MDSEKKRRKKGCTTFAQRWLKEPELKELVLRDLILAFMQLQIT